MLTCHLSDSTSAIDAFSGAWQTPPFFSCKLRRRSQAALLLSLQLVNNAELYSFPSFLQLAQKGKSLSRAVSRIHVLPVDQRWCSSLQGGNVGR